MDQEIVSDDGTDDVFNGSIISSMTDRYIRFFRDLKLFRFNL